MRRGGAILILAVGVLGLVAWDAQSTEEAVDRGASAAEATHATRHTGKKNHQGTHRPQPESGRRLRGTVVDARGVPVAGARVSALSRAEEALADVPCPDWAPEAEVSHSEEQPRRLMQDCLRAGRDLLLEWLPARMGEAILQAVTVTGIDGTYDLSGMDLYPISIWVESEAGVAVHSNVEGDQDDLRVVVTPGFTVDSVVSAEEAPLPDAHVTLVSTTTDRYFNARSGPDGRFHIGPLPNGLYVLLVEREGWQPALIPLSDDYNVSDNGVRLTRPLHHTGRVRAQGRPVSGARVELVFSDLQLNDSHQVATTNEEGVFHFPGLSEDALELSTFHDGMSASKQVTLTDREGATSILELKPTPIIEGIVQTEAHQPIAGAHIHLLNSGSSGSHPAATTGLDGRFRLGPLSPKTRAIKVSAPGYLDKPAPLHSLSEKSPATIILTRAMTITGVAVDATGAPAPHVRLALSYLQCKSESRDHSHSTMTDDTGHFELKACHSGEWDLDTAGERFLDQTIPVHAPSEGVRISLKQGPTLMGTVFDERGVPVPDAGVDLSERGESEIFRRYASSDAQGRFRLGAVRPGRYVVRARREMLGVARMVSQDVELREDAQSEVDLRLPEGETVSGVVVTRGGKPIAGATVIVHQASPVADIEPPGTLSPGCGRWPAGVRTGADGRFALPNVPSELHAVDVSKQGHTFVAEQSQGGTTDRDTTFFVHPGEPSIRLVMQRESVIRGRLLGPDGAPIPEFTVNGDSVRRQDGTFEHSTTKSGTRTFGFNAAGMARRTLTVEVPLEGVLELGDIHLNSGRSIHGRLLDAVTSKPIRHAELMLSDRGSTAAPWAWYDNRVSALDGTFTLEHVGEAPAELSVDAHGYQRYVGTVTGGENQLIRLKPGILVDVAVRNSQGAPVEAMVEFLRDGDFHADTLSTLMGEAVHSGMKPGFYTVSARAFSVTRPVGAVPHFAPQRLHVPDSGRLAIEFVEQTTGVTVTLHNPTERGSRPILFPGQVPAPTSPVSAELVLINEGMQPEWHDPAGKMARYLKVPPGRVTLFMFSATAPLHFHREELTIPASGEIVHPLVPNWQPLPSPGE